MNNQLNYDGITNLLSQHGVIVDGAEVHGILSGMLCGGMSLTDRKWMNVLSDTINQGDDFNHEIQQCLNDLFNQTCEQLLESEFALQLLLPDDKAPINDRGMAIINWVQGFMLGFGLFQQDLVPCSEEVREALEDFANIAQMEEPMSEDEESERALFEVMEYVKISALLCYSELGKTLLDDHPEKPSLH